MWRRLAAAVLAGVAAVALTASGVSDRYELALRDGVLRALSGEDAAFTTAVVIDERSLRELGPWPWPRERLAALVEQVSGSGASGVVLDVLLADSRPGDDDLARALSHTRSVLIAALDEEGEWIAPAEPLRRAATLSHAAFEFDADGVLRRFSSTKQSSVHALPAVPLAAAHLGGASFPLSTGRPIRPSFRVRPRDVPAVSAADLLRAGRDTALRGKVVFIGLTAHALGDRVVTPVSLRDAGDPGVLVHAAATESLLRGEVVRLIPPWVAGACAAAIVLLVGPVRRLRRPRSAGVALILASAVAGVAALTGAGVAAPVVTLTLAAVLAVLAGDMAAASRRAARAEALRAETTRLREEELEAKRILAHELKTPVAAVRNLAQLLAEFELSDEERTRVTKLIGQESERLATTVECLLALERLAVRDFASTTSDLDGGALLAAVVESLRAATGRRIDLDLEPDVTLRGDPALLRRAVENLVGNAVKFSPPDAPVHVRMRGAAVDVSIEVEDEGPGIAPEEREMIFRRFARGRAAARTEGLGLGLALVADIARWHGGAVTVESAPAGGSLFRLALPRAAAATLPEAV